MAIKPIDKGGGKWLIRVSCGYENGQKRMIKRTIQLDPSMTKNAQLKEAEKQTALIMAEYEAGKVACSKRMTVRELSEMWMESYIKPRNLSPKTVYGYQYLLESRIIPRLGRAYVQDVRPALLNRFYASMRNEKTTHTKSGHLSGTTQKRYHQVLNSMFTCAVRWQIIAVNPVTAIEPPRADTKEITPYTAEQSLLLLEALEGEMKLWKAVVYVALYAQLRRGEIAALDWSCVDLDNGEINTKQSAIYIPGEGTTIKKPKTKASNRSVSVPQCVVDALRDWKKEQAAVRLMAGEEWRECGAVFTNEYGERLHVDSITKWFDRFLARNNLPRIRLHDLRHTGASLLISAGMDIETVKNRLGHSRASTTMDIYGHAYKENDKKAANALDTILSKKA